MVTLYVIALLCVDDTVLMIRRHNATFGDGLYSLVGGKVEQGEAGYQAIKREVEEEVGLTLAESDFELVHTLHRNGTKSEFIALCFKADITGMHPYNAEQEKHDDMQFFNMEHLPENIVPAHKQVLDDVERGIYYSQHGW